MLFWQLFLYCLFFTAMVKLAVGSSAVNGLFFYPQAVQERAFALGLSDRETVRRRFRRFMAAFYLVMPAALLGIVGGWNGIRDFGGAYRQSLLFLEVMNVYDGVVIDKLWVGHSRFWRLPGAGGSALRAELGASAAQALQAGPGLDRGRGPGSRAGSADLLIGTGTGPGGGIRRGLSAGRGCSFLGERFQMACRILQFISYN